MVTVTASGGTIAEGDTTREQLYFNIELDQVSSEGIYVPWRMVGGSKGSLYYNNYNYLTGREYFRPGETVEQVRAYISPDFEAEPDESITFEILPSTNADLPGDAMTHQTVGWVLDDDGTSNPRALWVSDPIYVEGSSDEVIYDLSISRSSTSQIRIPYTLSGSADPGEDFVRKSGTVTFGAGQTDASLSVKLKNGRTPEALEHLNLELDLPGSIAESWGGQAQIVDDDHGTGPYVTATGGSIEEGDSSYETLIYSIALSAPSAEAITVPWRIAQSSTGTPGSDLRYSTVNYTTGNAYFSPGETQEHVRLYVVGDAELERDEAFVMEVLTPTGGRLPGNVTAIEATGWVIDDDASGSGLALQVSNPKVRETDRDLATASFAFELSQAAPRDLEISYRTTGGSAQKGSDFKGTSGTVTIAEGQRTASVGVDIKADNCFEDNETFGLQLFLPGAIKQVSGGTATIINDDLQTDRCLVTGNGRDNVMRGDAQGEVMRGRGGDDRMFGNGGSDKMVGDTGRDDMHGGSGNDRMFGEEARDKLDGGNGHDLCEGGAGNDRVEGGSGNDRLRGGEGNDKMRGGSGSDTMSGGLGSDDMRGGSGSDTMSGGLGSDDMRGGDGRDELLGGRGGDDLDGGRGRDRLDGGRGKDVLEGGGGNDIFVFNARDGADRIRDFDDGSDVMLIESGARGYGRLDISRRGDHVEVAWKSTEVLLLNTDIDDIGRGDFIF